MPLQLPQLLRLRTTDPAGPPAERADAARPRVRTPLRTSRTFLVVSRAAVRVCEVPHALVPGAPMFVTERITPASSMDLEPFLPV